jgi:SAM-dependent methyltransferase
MGVPIVPEAVLLEQDKSTDMVARHEAQTCPLCAASGPRVWLKAPDRFHGRRKPYTLARCSDCSLVWLVDPPRPGEMHLHYTDAYHKLIAAAGESSPARWKFRKETVASFRQAGTLLDLGCSSGSFLECFRDGNWRLFGIEMSAENAQKAEATTGAQVFTGDILGATFPPESFDVITCFDVLEHLYEPRRVMARVAEWLKPGGNFYVLIPNIDSAEARVFGTYWHGLELPRHLFHYCPESLTALAQSVGLHTLMLKTRRNPAVGTSMRYLWDDVLASIGILRIPVAYKARPGLIWRATRKLVRMTILQLLLGMASLAGGGESIHAVFQKPAAARLPELS